jgi:hypothetical protein
VSSSKFSTTGMMVRPSLVASDDRLDVAVVLEAVADDDPVRASSVIDMTASSSGLEPTSSPKPNSLP